MNQTPAPVVELVERLLAVLPAQVIASAILGGGAIRSMFDGTPLRDIDLFFRNREDYLIAEEAMRAIFAPITGGCPNYPTYSIGGFEVNLAGFRFRSTVQQTSDAFDFTCCAFAVSLADTNEYCEYVSARDDAESKRLRFLNLQRPPRVLKRMAKYIDRYSYTHAEDFIEQMPECWQVEPSDEDHSEYDNV